MHITVKQGIDNCYLAHKYEHPGYEEDRCAGLRTGNGEGIVMIAKNVRRSENETNRCRRRNKED